MVCNIEKNVRKYFRMLFMRVWMGYTDENIMGKEIKTREKWANDY